ncbi:MAG TPA: DMT family transporter [Candidatus Blautia avistercoris]|nr:DMT family transporter [Candidatus Blautia avistercoris]
MKRASVKNSLLLLLTATIWGVAFVAQSVGMDYIEPFTFNCIRSILGGITLLPVIFLGKGKSEPPSRTLLAGGICCGILLFAASNFQQFGIQYTTVGKAGFITACYIILVPIMGIFLKKKCTPLIWLSVLFALAGLYLLCITEEFSLGKGDVLVLICSFLFALHILVIDYFSPKTDGVKMSCIQFFVCGILSGICMLFTETPSFSNIRSAAVPLLYAGIFSCGVAYTLQIVGQKNMNPTVASLILSLESSISVLAGWILLGQSLGLREAAGCILMFAAILLAQLPVKKTGKNFIF